MTLLRCLTFLLGSLTLTLTVLLIWIYFFLLMLVFALQLISIHWKILIMLLPQFPFFFLLNSKRDAPFHCIAYDCSCADRDSLCDHLREVPWKYIFKVSVSAAASKFWKWLQVRIDVYIPHRKYHVKSHTSPWFSAACTAAIVHRNHIFHLYKQNKYSESKVKFRQSSSCYKMVLQAVKLAYVNKTRVLHFPETWLSGILANCQ